MPTPFARPLTALAAALALALTAPAWAADPKPGLDSTGFDPATRVQDDLFKAVNGGWLAKTEIPADKPQIGAFHLLRDLSDERVRAVVEELAAKPQKPGSVEAKIAAFYGSYVDIAAIDKAGLKPLQPLLASVDAIKTRADLARWLGRMQGQVNAPVVFFVLADFKDPGTNRAVSFQGGLGMPDRDYYFKADDKLTLARAAYETYLTTLARLSGEKAPEDVARDVIGLERQIAQVHWSQVDSRDFGKLYNPMTPAELTKFAPGLDWRALLDAAGLAKIDRLIVAQPSAMSGIAALLATQDLGLIKHYLKLRLLDDNAEVLAKPLRDARFAFQGTAITGTTEERPRWQTGVAEVNGSLGEALGQVYVARHFPPEHKQRMLSLVNNLLAAYGESIDALTWMSPATKAAAKDKLSKYAVKIGYPDVWRDYSALDVRPGDALGNRNRSGRFEWLRLAARAGQPVDRKEWGLTPQTVNAYYSPWGNEIVFPAAILQPPFFDATADDAVNYGGIGAVIGHEISHGFDDSGAKFDGDGKLRNWWTPEDLKAFEAVGARLVAQYDKYEALPGKTVNGRLTLGENIADLSGLQIAYKAYLRSLGGKPAPVLGGLTGPQRFFMGWSQVWRQKTREQRSLQLLTTDSHSPPQFRANGAAINHDGFHEAFGTKPGDAMFKASEERIRIW